MAQRFPGLEADDLIQETFIAVARAIPGYRYAPDEKGRFRNLLTGILHHKTLNTLRSSTGPARASKTPARATSCTKARLWSFRKYRATKTQNANSL